MREVSVDRFHLGGLATDILERGGVFRFRVSGCSMRPFIKDGDVLEVQPIDVETLRYADVVLYYRENHHLVAHRVVKRSGEKPPFSLLLQGDASIDGLETVAYDHVLGRVSRIKRGDRGIAMDAGLWRWLGVVWVALSPLVRQLYWTAIECKGRISIKKSGCKIA